MLKEFVNDKKKFGILTAIISVILILVTIGICFIFKGTSIQAINYTNLINTQSQNVEILIGEYIDINELAEQPQVLIGEYIDINQLAEENVTIEDITVKNTNVVDKNDNTNKNAKTITGTTPYYIKVNYVTQVVTVYTKDENQNYAIPVKAMICSTGTHTPKSGVYSIPARWNWLGLQGNVYGHYCTQIKGNILFHSVPYLRRGDNASLEYWEYDKLGTYASAGCVRLTLQDAKWIFDNCAKGTKVEFCSDSSSDKLGKPSVKKISSYPDYLRNWDPTDPDERNPWRTYNEETNKKENVSIPKTENNQTTDNNIKENKVNNTIQENENSNKNINTSNNVEINKNVMVNEQT